MSKTDTDIACKIVEKALRNRVIGGKHYPVEGLLRVALPDHLQGRGGEILHQEMIPNHKAGLTYVKGKETVTISDTEKAVRFLKENAGNVPFNFQ